MLLIGTLIAVHWLCFYGAIKVSNISVTMATFSSGAFFTSLIEPIFYKRKIFLYELLLGMVVITGMSIIFSTSLEFRWGFVLGILAALLSSVFSVLNSLLAKETSSVQMSTYELFFAWIMLSIYLYSTDNVSPSFFQVDARNWLGLSLLSYGCTAIPFVIAIDLMRHINPYTMNLTVNMESIYGIILAIIIYKENKYLNMNFYIGFILILSSIFLNAYFKYLQRKKVNISLVLSKKETDKKF